MDQRTDPAGPDGRDPAVDADPDVPMMSDDRATPRPRLVRVRSVACACNEHARPAP